MITKKQIAKSSIKKRPTTYNLQPYKVMLRLEITSHYGKGGLWTRDDDLCDLKSCFLNPKRLARVTANVLMVRRNLFSQNQVNSSMQSGIVNTNGKVPKANEKAEKTTCH